MKVGIFIEMVREPISCKALWAFIKNIHVYILKRSRVLLINKIQFLTLIEWNPIRIKATFTYFFLFQNFNKKEKKSKQDKDCRQVILHSHNVTQINKSFSFFYLHNCFPLYLTILCIYLFLLNHSSTSWPFNKI